MGRKKKPSASRPKPSSSSSSSSTPPQSDAVAASKLAAAALSSKSYGKAQKIIKEALSKHKDSPILHRMNALIHFELASLLDYSNPAPKIKQLNESALSSHRATMLSPNSVALSCFYVLVLVELSKLNKDYDKAIQECDRALSIRNPTVSLDDAVIEDVETELSPESEIENVLKDIVYFKRAMKCAKILDVDVDGEERIRYRPLVQEDRTKKESEFKELVKRKTGLEKKLDEMMNMRRQLSLGLKSGKLSEKKKLAELSRIGENAKRTARAREFWNQRMSGESKKRLLEVRIDELEQHFDKDKVLREALMEAIAYKKDYGTWEFWECCFCGEKCVNCEAGLMHCEIVHVGVLSTKLQSVLPREVCQSWVDMIKNGDWRPVNTPFAVEMIVTELNVDEEWPVSDHTERAEILDAIRSMFKLFLDKKCLVGSLLLRMVEYAIGQLITMVPLSLLEKYELDNSLHCLRFLSIPELNNALKFMQELYDLCDLNGLKENEVIDTEFEINNERIEFSSDFNCLLVDERLLRGNIVHDVYGKAVVADGSAATSAVDDCKDDVLPVSDEVVMVMEDGSIVSSAVDDCKDDELISDDIITWLYCFPIEEQVASWTRLRGYKHGGTNGFEIPDKDFSNLKSLCERKCDFKTYYTAFAAIDKLIIDEDLRRKQFPESEKQTDLSVLRQRRKELIERDGDAVFKTTQLLLDVIRDLMEEALSLGFHEFRFEESGKEDEANNYTREAFKRLFKRQLDENAKIDAMIARHVAAMQKFKLKLRRVCAYDYRSIMLPLLKLFIQAHLEDLVDKDASEKSAAAQEALLAELALDAEKNIGKGGDPEKKVQQKSKDKKKKKDRKKPKDSKETGRNEDPVVHQEDAEQVDVPVASVSVKEQEEEFLNQKLEYQRRFEIGAKEKQLSEKNVTIAVNMTEGVPDKQFHSEISGLSSSYYEKSQQNLLVDETRIPKFPSGFPVSTTKGTKGKSSSVSGAQGRKKKSHSHDKFEQGPPNQGKPEGALPSDQRKECQDSYSGALLTKKEMFEGRILQIEIITRVKSVDQDTVQRRKKTFQEQEDFPSKEEQKLSEKISLEGEEFGRLQIGVGTGLKNDIGCVLNVNIQSLWNLRPFRDEFMAVPESMHDHGDPCVFCELHKIFSHLSISATEIQEEAVDPTSLKIALGSLQPDGTSFMEAQMKDASEVLEFIFESLHLSFNSGFAASIAEIEGKNILCYDCTSSVCLVHKLFGLSILEKMNCDNCDLESRCRKYTTCFHKINAGELRRMKNMHGDRSFDELLKRLVMNHEFPCHSEKGGGCGNLNRIHHILFTLPHFFTTVLGWQTNSENEDDISETLTALTAEIDLGLLYPNLVPGYKYCIVSVVCYHQLHYICFAYSHESKTWIMYDDEIVKAIGCWGDVLTKCKEQCYQPQVLFFEAVSQFKDIKLEPTCTYHHGKKYALGGSIL